MRWPSLWRREPRANRLAAVGVMPHGVALARVAREEGHPVALDLCEFVATESDEQAGEALATWAREHGLDEVRCTTVMEAEAYSLLLVEAPDVPREELPAAVRWRIKDLIDFPLEDAVIDVFDAPAQKASAQRPMVYVVVARVTTVRDRIQRLEDAGLRLAVVDVPELALRNLAACLPEDAAGVALLYLSRDAGLITLTRQSVLYFARRIEYGLNALGPQRSGQEDSVGGTLLSPMGGGLDNLVVEVQRSLDYYESHFTQAPIANLVVAPLEQTIPGMPEYLETQLGVSVRALDLGSVIDCRERVEQSIQAHCFPAIGAALRAT